MFVHFFEMFFRDLFQLFFGGGGGRDIELLTPRYASMYSYSGDSLHHKHLTAMWARMVV